MTAPAHVLVFRPIIPRLRGRGHEVEVTARDYAQTLELLELHGMEHTAFGRHGGASRLSKLRSLLSRSRAMRRFARKRGFDLAVAHGSNDLALSARRLRIPAVNMFDYEFATLQHNIGCRPARRVMTPDTIPPERLQPLRRRPRQAGPVPGPQGGVLPRRLQPDEGVLGRLGLDREKVIVVVRPPPDVSLYHRKSNPLFPQVLDAHRATTRTSRRSCCPAPTPSASTCARWSCPRWCVAEHAVDAQSLVALADLVVSAGGTMNREAVALGTPVYTTYGGRLGGVDEALIREHRLRPLTDPRGLELVKRDGDRRAAAARSGAAGRHDPRSRRMTPARSSVREQQQRASAPPAEAALPRAVRPGRPEPVQHHETLAERYARDGARGSPLREASTSPCARSTCRSQVPPAWCSPRCWWWWRCRSASPRAARCSTAGGVSAARAGSSRCSSSAR